MFPSINEIVKALNEAGVPVSEVIPADEGNLTDAAIEITNELSIQYSDLYRYVGVTEELDEGTFRCFGDQFEDINIPILVEKVKETFLRLKK